MKLKGNYNSGTSYSVGDAVRGSVGWHKLVKSASAGTPVTDTRYWQQLDPEDWDMYDVIQNVLDLLGELTPNPKNIVLASSTDASVKKFKIQVVDNGTISASEIS